MNAFWLSAWLGLWTTLILLPLALLIGRALAMSQSRWKPWIESVLLLPLVLPPTVIGYYFLVTFSPATALGQTLQNLLGFPLVFSFQGLVIASVIINLPFAILPIQQAYTAVPNELREAAWVSGLSRLSTWWRIELPLSWPGILSATALVFAHTLGEFGVVLMVGGNIEGSTRTLSIAIYDSVQGFDMQTAGRYSLLLLLFSLLSLVAMRLSPGGKHASHAKPESHGRS